MDKNFQVVVDTILSRHWANSPVTDQEIAAFESLVGFDLGAEFRYFYKKCDGAKLYSVEDPEYYILPLAKIKRARVVMYGCDEDQYGSPEIYVFCRVDDVGYAGINVASTGLPEFSIVDCYPDTFASEGYNTKIAKCFSDFVINTVEAKHHPYWFSKGRTQQEQPDW